MHRFEAISRIGQRSTDDDAHRVIEIRTAHFIFEADGECFLGKGVYRLFHFSRTELECFSERIAILGGKSSNPTGLAVQNPTIARKLAQYKQDFRLPQEPTQQ